MDNIWFEKFSNIWLHPYSKLFPNSEISFNSNVNAISRIIIVITILGVLLLNNKEGVFITGVICIGALYIIYRNRKKTEGT